MSGKGPGSLGGRRESRERAVELSYEMTQREWTVEQVLDSLPLPPEPYTLILLNAAELERSRIDELISSKSKWKIARMPLMDLIITRLAVAEFLQTDTPTGVVLAEAVDLAGRYSTDESAKYVNGVLSAIGREVRTK